MFIYLVICIALDVVASSMLVSLDRLVLRLVRIALDILSAAA
jgi:hypothetical protein